MTNTLRRTIAPLAIFAASAALVVGTGISSASAVDDSVSAVAVTVASPTVYPSHDHYRDSDVITVTPTTESPTAVVVTGTLTVTRKGKTVANWPITTSDPSTETWDGRSNGKIVAGTYTVTATITGQPTAVTGGTTVAVSAKKLHSVTMTVTHSGAHFFSQLDPAAHDGARCYRHKSSLYCVSTKATSANAFSLNDAKVPSKVFTYAAAIAPRVRVRANFTKVSLHGGQVNWIFGNTSDPLSLDKVVKTAGLKTLGPVSFASDSTKIGVEIGAVDGALVHVRSISIKYYYSVLR